MGAKHRLPVLLQLLWLAGIPATASQSCDTRSYPLSTPSVRFADNGDGTLTDTRSGLMWMRCALGQQWTGATCSGAPSAYSWQAAQGAAVELNRHGGYAKFTDWRVPHIPELAMIVERQCANPRINLDLFPATPAAYFWTATGRRGPGMNAEAYLLSFGPEGAAHNAKQDLHFARLVRAVAPADADPGARSEGAR
jgi:hypothetical protein